MWVVVRWCRLTSGHCSKAIQCYVTTCSSQGRAGAGHASTSSLANWDHRRSALLFNSMPTAKPLCRSTHGRLLTGTHPQRATIVEGRTRCSSKEQSIRVPKAG